MTVEHVAVALLWSLSKFIRLDVSSGDQVVTGITLPTSRPVGSPRPRPLPAGLAIQDYAADGQTDELVAARLVTKSSLRPGRPSEVLVRNVSLPPLPPTEAL
jgi:hypothetical protein